MSNAEILEKAIQKAIDGGWNHPYKQSSGFKFAVIWHELGDWSYIKVAFDSLVGEQSWDIQRLIFNHDFAKALWGEETERVWLCPKCGYSFDYTWHGETEDHCPQDGRKLRDTTRVKEFGDHPWQYHLQQMVIADDPIQYLGENI